MVLVYVHVTVEKIEDACFMLTISKIKQPQKLIGPSSCSVI